MPRAIALEEAEERVGQHMGMRLLKVHLLQSNWYTGTTTRGDAVQ